ncbi:hypothetical protein F5884DRAFT_760322 [Xylogone sp. PMI_703]|nr:hypothetical protein F5884DRAFT_760322 [Xylogone sp. PMI_703]
MASPPKYIPNTATAETLESLPDTRDQLIKSLTTIIVGSPPRKPWSDSFKPNPQGLWTGPSSIAYLFFWLSKTHPDMLIKGKTPTDWCLAYLDCGSDMHPVAGNGIGVKNEYMAFNAVKAIATKDIAAIENLKIAAAAANIEAAAVDNEFLSGRAGTLALLRIVRRWIPEVKEELDSVMEPIIKHILERQPWSFHNVAYIGAAHGSIGIITQIVLCNPSYATVLEQSLVEHLDAQNENGNWFVRAGLPDSANLVQFCHGAPGFVLSLLKMRPYFPSIHDRIDKAIELARKCIWERGILKKEPNLCHGATGNALALESPQREHFMSYATVEKIQAGIEDGTYIKGDDRYGLQWGEAGRAWGWMVFDISDVQEKGWPGYTDA